MRKRYLIVIVYLLTLNTLYGAKPEIEITLLESKILTTKPKEILTVVLRITNRASRYREFASQIELPENWKPISSDDTFGLESGQSTIRLVSFYVPQTTLSGDYSVKYSVIDQQKTVVNQQLTLNIDVLPARKLSLTVEDMPVYVLGGDKYQVTFKLMNTGNITATVKLKAESNARLPTDLNISLFELAAGEFSTITAVVKTDDNIRSSVKHYLNLKAEVLDEPDVTVNAGGTTEIVARKSVAQSSIKKIPLFSTIRQVIQNESNYKSGIQGELFASGHLDTEKNKQIKFLLRGPDVFDRSVFGVHDEKYLRYSTRDYEIFLGDYSFGLTWLTERYRYGRGIHGKLNVSRFTLGGYRMKTRFFLPVQDQSAAFLQFHLNQNSTVSLNYLNKSASDRDVSIYSVGGHFKAFDTDVEVEHARGNKSGVKDNAYSLRVAGRQKKVSYALNILHANPEFFGYSNNVTFTSAGLALPLTGRLRLTAGIRREKNSDPLSRSLELIRSNNGYQLGVDYRLMKGPMLSLQWRSNQIENLRQEPGEKTKENALRFGLSHNFKKFNVNGSADLGRAHDGIDDSTSAFQRLSGSLNFSPTRQYLFDAFINYDNSRTFFNENRRNIVAGLKTFFRISRNTHFQLNLQTSNYNSTSQDIQSLFRRDRDQLEIRLSQILPLDSRISMVGRHIAHRNTSAPDQTSFLLEYSVPIDIPVSRKRQGGMIKGRVYDQKNGQPMSNIILRLNEKAAVTDGKGKFVFAALRPGIYYLTIDRASLDLGRIPVQKTPMRISVRDGDKHLIDFAIARSCALSGQLTVYRYEQSADHRPEGKTDSLDTQNLYLSGSGNDVISFSEDKPIKLVETHGLKNTLVQMSNGAIVARRVTDPSGRFHFEDLPPGKWTLSLYDHNLPDYHYFENDSISIEFTSGQEKSVFIRVLPRKRSIRFKESGVTLAVGESTEKSTKSATGLEPVTEEFEEYTIQPGDWLSKIAKRCYGFVTKYDPIFEANRDSIKDPNRIYPGQLIRIPRPKTEDEAYRVKPGDTLSKIAKYFYGDAKQFAGLFEANRNQIQKPNLIHPGDKLRIPALKEESCF